MVSLAAQQRTNRNALVFYRDHIVSEQEKRQLSLIRKGKSPASAQDDATEHAFEHELAAIDALLDSQPDRPAAPMSDPASPQSSLWTRLAPRPTAVRDEEPYINPFTGLLVVPETANGPGPSNSRGKNASSEHFNLSGHLSTDRNQDWCSQISIDAPNRPIPLGISDSRVPESSADPSRANYPSPSFHDTFTASSSGLKSEQNWTGLPEASEATQTFKSSFWNAAASAMKSAAVYVFRMDTTPSTSSSIQTSTLPPDLPYAGNNFSFPLQQNASSTWKRLLHPPTDSQASFGAPTGSLVSRKPLPSSVSAPSNKTAPIEKTRSTSAVSNVGSLTSAQGLGKHASLLTLVKPWRTSQRELARSISVADAADCKELEAVRRLQEEILRQDRVLEQQEAVARQIQADLDREHERFLTAQTADRKLRKQEATMRRQRAEETAERQEREAYTRHLQAVEGERLRAQETLARHRQTEENDRLRQQETLARRFQEKYDREHAEQEAYARQLQEKYYRDFRQEQTTLASQEAHARKIQAAWDAELEPPDQEERNDDPPPQYTPAPPPRPPPSPVGTATTGSSRTFRAPFGERHDWRGTLIWRPPTPPLGTATDHRRIYRPPPAISPTRSPAPPIPTATTTATATPRSPPKQQPPPQIDCTACLAPHTPTSLTTLPCRHPYCTPCLSAALRASLSQRPARPFTCCKSSSSSGGPLPPSLASAHLPPALSARYTLVYTEHTDPSPLHCALPRCGAYIPPAQRRGTSAACTACASETCLLCRQRGHSGVCKADKAGQKLMALAKDKGWRVCGRCGSVVERKDGCLHMTCRCAYEFCYACGKQYTGGRGGCRGDCHRR